MPVTNEQRQSHTPRLWLVYFPRACHHLFMRMFAKHTALEILEVFAHTVSTVGATIQLSAHENLNCSSKEVAAECASLKDKNLQSWHKWMSSVEDLERAGKRVMSSSSVAFHISPAVHNWLLHHNFSNGFSEQGPVREEQRSGEAHRIPTVTSLAPSSPASVAYWRLPSASDQEPDLIDDNPTVFPTSFLQSHQPILLIRHPVRAFPSTLRAGTTYFKSAMGDTFMNVILRYRWHRMLYDWFTAHSSPSLPEAKRAPQPLVLDADDLMYNREAIQELCRRVGLDPTEMQYEWDTMKLSDVKTSYETEEVFMDTLAASSGIVPGQGSDSVRLEEQYPEWEKEFGTQRANRVRELVGEAMQDYEYLRQRSIGATMQKA